MNQKAGLFSSSKPLNAMRGALSVALVFIFSFSLFAGDRYWVGGTGNWSDASHWAANSAGQGGASIPTSNDNVWFDNSSFSQTNEVVSINGTAECKSITWQDTHDAIIKGDKLASLSVYSSIILNTSLQNQFEGTLYLKSKSFIDVNKISTAGQVIAGDIVIDGAGQWFLQDELITSENSTITIIKGTFITNGKNVTCGTFTTAGSAQREIQLGTSTIKVQGKWNLKDADNLKLEASKSTIVFNEKLTKNNFKTDHRLSYGIVSGKQSPLALTASIAIVDSNYCPNDAIATLVATATGGIPPYTYYWSGPITVTNISNNPTDTLKNAPNGPPYNLFIEDGNGEVDAASISLTISAIDVISFNPRQPSCFGGCDGRLTAIANGGGGLAGAGSAVYTYSWSNSVSTAVNNNICAGTYSITVTDQFGCTGTTAATLGQPAAVAPNGTAFPAGCFGQSTGSVGVSPSGGTPAYTYIWSNASTAATISSLPAGSYTLTLTDSKACSVIYVGTVTEPAAALSATPTIINASCAGVCNGSVGITPSGGTAGYAYNWADGPTAQTRTLLCAGGYTVTITDANSCTTVTNATVTEPVALAVTPSVSNNVTCFGACDGVALANASAGSAPYTYTWAPSGGTGATASGLCPATYTVTVTDAGNCTLTGTVAITEPFVLDPVAGSTDVACNTGLTGTAFANPTGGTGAYTYSWSTTAVSQTISGLGAGSYTVTVTDANLCSATSVVTITEPFALTVSTTTTDASCNGDCNGTATANVSGGTTNYTYLWMPTAQATTIANTLCANTYTVTVTDANSCTATSTAVVGQPAALTASIATTTLSCNADCNATATASGGGGFGLYTYFWNTGGITSVISSLCAGTYSVTITDANLCTATSSATITEPQPIAITLTPASTSCNLVCDGSVSSLVLGGTGAYTYSWSSGGTGATESGLCASTYTVTVTDVNLCTATSTATVTEPFAISGNTSVLNNLSCFGVCTGSALAAPTGGTSPFGYNWSNGDVGATASALCAQTYTVTITDINLCTATSTVTITEPPAFTVGAVTTAASCGLCNGQAVANPGGGTAGYSHVWSTGSVAATISGLCTGTYTVTSTDALGCTAVGTAVIAPVVVLTVNTFTTAISCNGACDGSVAVSSSGGTLPHVYSWSSGETALTVGSKCAGTYTVTVTDFAGCSNTATASLVDPLVLAANASNTDATCNAVCDGSVSASPTGGTGAYTYLWSSGSTAQTISAACAGNYTVTVTDASGCTDTGALTVTEPAVVNDVSTLSDATCGACDGAISVNPIGGIAPYTYSWSNGAAAVTGISALCPGAYALTITSAGSGTCQQVFNYNISNLNAPTIAKSVAHNTCNNSCDASVTVTLAGINPPFTYVWSTGTTGVGNVTTENNLCAGIYTITATDALGCIRIDTVNVTEPSIITPGDIHSDVTCGGLCDGAIFLNPNGGNAGAYTFAWSDGPATTQTRVGLCQATYTFTITDVLGCDTINSITITEPLALTNFMITTDVDCKAACNGAIFAFAGGGTPAINYAWSSSGNTTNLETNLCPATYTVTITDANGCSLISTATITEPAAALSAALTPTDASCFGVCDGSIVVAAAGGTIGGGYNYLWSNGSTAATISGLCVGGYTVTTTDANGCTTVNNTTINSPAQIFPNVTPVDANCNGVCDGSAFSAPSGGNGTFTFTWSTGITAATVTNLCAADYTLTVTSGGCDVVQSPITINQPAVIASTVTGVNPTCSSGSDGSATSTPVGGTSPYTFAWSNLMGATGVTSSTISSLAVGTYSVTVTDSNGCTDVSTVALVTPASISISSQTITPSNCTLCVGAIDITPVGGTGAYTYVWSNGPVTEDVASVCAAIYTVTITDANGCSVESTFIVNDVGGPTGATWTIVNDSCAGSCTGSATVVGIGGTGLLTYSWTDGSAANPRMNMCAGPYVVSITDANGCLFLSPDTITEPLPLDASAITANASCSGICDGQIVATGSGGTTPYTFAWSSGGTGATESSLCAGTYTLTISDSNLCSSVKTFTVSNTTTLAATTSQTDLLCFGLTNGDATVNVTSGTPAFTYLWSDGLAQTTQTAVGLTAGGYTVTVTDFNGCNAPFNVTLTEPGDIVLTPVITDVSCAGVCNGSIVLTPSGGTSPFDFVWSNAATGNTISSLCPGNYTVTASDINACSSVQTYSVGISLFAFTSTVTPVDATCGSCNGAASVATTGGASPFSYDWSNSATGATISALCSGAYGLTITDNNGCMITDAALINNTGAPTSSGDVVTNVSCNGASTGAISLTPSGGVAPYTYQWLVLGATTSNVSNLPAGTYTVQITGANGCAMFDTISVAEPSGFVLNESYTAPTSCGVCDATAFVNPSGGTSPYTMLWSNGGAGTTISALCPGSYVVTISDAGSCTQSTTVLINDLNAPTLNPTVNKNASCGGTCDGIASANPTGGAPGYTFLWSEGTATDTIKNMCVSTGTYFVTVTDNVGCIANTSVSITEPALLQLLTPTITDASCAGVCNGSAVASVTGGTQPYTFVWSNAATGITASGLCSGNYDVTVTDAGGCTVSQTIIINDNPIFTVTVTPVDATCGLCNGSASVAITGGTPVFNINWSNSATGTTASSLCAGAYNLTVTDANGCSVSDAASINNSGAPTASGKTVTNITCNAACNGSIALNPSGGTAPYTYLWLGGGQATSGISGQCAGTYTVQITGANGCAMIDTATISEPAAFVFGDGYTAPTSCGVCDATAFVNPSGGTSPYTMSWSSGGAGTTESALCAGFYTVTVTDNSGCAQTTIVTINDLNAPTLNPTVNSTVSCFGTCDGVASANASGGAGGYLYSWSDSPSTNSDTIKTLCVSIGTYFVKVTDAAGCVVNGSVSITEPQILLLTAPTKTDASCSGVCNGTAVATATGGTQPYTFIWSNGTTGNTASALCAGNYDVTVTDDNGCTYIQTINISNAPIYTVSVSVTGATCGSCNGTAIATPMGGVSPFTYLWSSAVTGATASGLCAGVYNSSITDAIGCSTNITVPVSNTSGPTSSGKVITSNTCYGQCVGSVTLSPAGGTLPYTYAWTNGSTASNLSNLCAGTLYVQITDSNGCSLVDTVMITQPAQFFFDVATVLPSSCTVCDGSAIISPSGGTSPYVITWSSTASGNTATALCAGIYTVTVTDNVSCAQTKVVTLNDRNAPSLSPTVTSNVSCQGACDGIASGNASGGTGAYTYLWNDGAATTSDTVKTLCAGTYFVKVTDNIGCVKNDSVRITEPGILVTGNSTVNKVSCLSNCDGSIAVVASGGTIPFTYAWAPTGGTGSFAGSLCSANYTITVTDAEGCTTVRNDSVPSNSILTTTVTVTDANCNNTADGAVNLTVAGGTPTYTYAWSGPGSFASITEDIANLAQGTYSLTLTDINGCVKTDTAQVNALVTVIANAGTDTSACAGATFTLNGSGSISALKYAWYGPLLIDTLQMTPVTPSTGITDYLLVAMNGVCSDSDSVRITAAAPPVVDAGTETTILTLQNITLGGSPTSATGISFAWTPKSSVDDSTLTNPTASPLVTTTYTVFVTDNNGCVASDTVRITVVEEVVFNNGITPNNDGSNDTWIIDNISKFKTCEVEIYNRWGQLLFSSVGYTTPWDGTYKGKDLPVGTYYYVIKLNDPLFPEPFTGPITILR